MNRNTDRKPYYLERKIRSAKRKIIWHILQKPLGVVLVSEFPKSGGSWYAKMLAEILDLPFPRNNTPSKFRSSVLLGHVPYKKRFHKPIYVVRDGRDVMVSAYYHFLFENEYNIPEFVRSNRKKLNFGDFDNIEKNLPRFIEYMYFTHGKEIGHTTWSNYINEWTNTDALQIKYEDLLSKPLEKMAESVEYLDKTVSLDKIKSVVENNTFSVIQKENNDKQMSFARKGIAGDWKNHFSEEAKEVLKELGGKELILLGYEENDSW